MAFYASGTSVQSPVRAESAAAASTACGFRPSPMDGRGAFVVRRAVGEENHRSGTARSAPGASGTLHPSNCPGGEHDFEPSSTDGRGAFPRVAQPGKRIVAVEPPGTRRARVVRCIRPIARAASTASGRSQWTDAKTFREPRSRKSEGYARRCFASPAHPSSCPCGRNPRRRARLAASGRHWWTDAEPLSCVAQPGKRIIAVEPPGTRRARVVRCIRPITRAASTASGRSQWTDAKTFREPRSRKSEGYARRCFTSPAHPSSYPCGRNPWRRARLAASDRHQWTDAEPYRASRSRESGTAFYTSGTSVQSPVRAESAAAASTACSFRPSSMDGRGAFPCATQSRKE